MCSTATFGGCPAAPSADKAFAFHVRTVPAFAGWSDAASVDGAITPATATADAVKSALNLMNWVIAVLLGSFPKRGSAVRAGVPSVVITDFL
jgi:hypothetical protein